MSHFQQKTQSLEWKIKINFYIAKKKQCLKIQLYVHKVPNKMKLLVEEQSKDKKF